MNKIFYSILACVALAGFSSCNDDFIERGHNHAGQAVKFSVGQNKTRTAYLADNFNSEDTWKLKWLDDDEVRIFCDECQKSGDEVPSADYYVIPDEGAPSNGVLEDKGDDEDQLFWGGDGVTHNFYAGYPTTRITKCDKNGLMTFKIPTAQYCSLIEIKDEGGNFQDYATNSYNLGSNEEDAVSYINTAMDMSNAYMVANCSSTPDVENVCLAFSPIMTTLEIIVEGYQGVNGATLDLTGIAITMNVPSIDGRGEEFMYDVTHNQIVSDDTQKGIKTTPVSFMINLVNPASPINSITLKEGAKVKLTAFLPPMNITDENQIKVNVQGTGAFTHSVKIGGTGNNLIAAGTKRFISIAGLTKEVNIDVNNWISQLDGSIYVNQLSIPGTSHSASMSTYASTNGTNGAKAQSLSVEEQWKSGVRAFDFHTATPAEWATNTNTGGVYVAKQIQCYQSGYNCYNQNNPKSFVNYIADLSNYVSKNTINNERPGEFAIIILSNECMSANVFFGGQNMGNKSQWAYAGYTYQGILNSNDVRVEPIATVINDYAWDGTTGNGYGKIIPFKPDMTIDEARGHIILINFDTYGDPASDATAYGNYVNDTHRGGLFDAGQVFTGYPYWNKYSNYEGALVDNICSGATSDSKDNTFYTTGKEFSIHGKSTGTDAKIYIQNIRINSDSEIDGLPNVIRATCGQEEYVETKLAAARKADEYAQTLHSDPIKNKNWVINDLGGATGVNSMREARTPNFFDNAHIVNKRIYDYFTTGRPVGSTGIVLINHMGADYDAQYGEGAEDAEGTYCLYGKALPQLIINNNYQVPMKRKQSGSGAVIK